MVLFFRVDGATIDQAQDILKTILKTDNINRALTAGRRLKDILSIFSSVNTNPNVQKLIDVLIPKVQAGLDLAEITRKVKESIGTGGGGGGGTTTVVSVDVTPFTAKDGTDLRTDGQPQTAGWQLQWLFDNKLDKKDAVTMTEVSDEITKQLVNAGGTGSDASTTALRTINSAIASLDHDVKKVTDTANTNKATLTTHASNFAHLQAKIQQDANDLMNLNAQVQHLLPNMKSIGPPLPGLKKTVWEAIHDVRSYLEGVDEFVNEGSVSGKSVKTRLDELDAFYTNLNNFYNGLSNTVNVLEKKKVPEITKIEEVIGKSYLTSFATGTDTTLSARIAALESGTPTGPVSPQPEPQTSGTVPGRKYWYKETLLTNYVSNLSKLDAGKAKLEDVNTTYWYPPLEAAEHEHERETMGIWNGGTLRIFRGKCYIAVLLTFSVTKVGNTGRLNYRLRITSADLLTEVETVLASDRGELAPGQLATDGSTIHKCHIFHFRGNQGVESAMVRFNWHNNYPVKDSIYCGARMMYWAPVYYNPINGRAFMNPHPSALQERTHPIVPADELVYFGVISSSPRYMMQMLRMKLTTASFDVRFQKESGYVSAGKAWARGFDDTSRQLSVLANNGWANNTAVKIPSQKVFCDRLQGIRLYSWWGADCSTQGVVATPTLGADERLIRIFNHGSAEGKGLFMLACELPEFMVYGLQGQKYSVDLSILSLFGEAELCVEVIIVKQPPDMLGLCTYPQASQYDLFVRNDKTADGEVFVKGEGNLATVQVSANFDYVAPARYETLTKKYIAAPKIAADEITYKDPLTRNELSDATVSTLTGKYKSLEDVVSFDMGTFPDRSDVQSLFIVVYPKYYTGGEYDFACRANFTFRFAGDDGIVGEGMWVAADTPDIWMGNSDVFYEL